MKKIYSYLILAITLFYGLSSYAQAPYHKMIASNATDWYIFDAHLAVKPAGGTTVNYIYLQQGKYTAMDDTVISSSTYKKMKHVYSSPGFNSNQLIGCIREDSVARKVYFVEANTTSEVTLYDFSLTQGAVVNLNFPTNFGQFPSGSYNLVVVDSVMTRVGFRKQQKFVGFSGDTLVHIESIGSVIHPLYLFQSDYGYGQFMFGSFNPCSYQYGLGLACKESNNQKFFQSCTYELALMSGCIYEYDSCNYYNNCSGIQEIASKIQHRILPNPASNQITLEIELDNKEAIQVDLFDISGRKLKTLYTGKILSNNKAISMDVSTFENGYYFLKIYNKDFTINNPIIIAR